MLHTECRQHGWCGGPSFLGMGADQLFLLALKRDLAAIAIRTIREFAKVRFVQKPTMLARYMALDAPAWAKRRSQLLPLANVWIGPGNHPSFTAISVRLLLEQMGISTS